MISVVLSTNNEIKHNYLERLLVAITKQDCEYEIIVVDNESQDGTVEMCKKFTNKIYSLPSSNRAQRYNYGFKKSAGEIVIFHHPVCILPENSFLDVENALKGEYVWGGFTHSFDHQSLWLKFTSWYSNNIRGKRGIMYVDHCIFVKRKYAEKTSLFGEFDIFEDSVISKNMLKFSKPIIIKNKLITSARRFLKRGILKQIFMNMLMKTMYYLKLDHKLMNRIYEKKEGYNVKYK